MFCYYLQCLIKILYLQTKNMRCIHGTQDVQTSSFFVFKFRLRMLLPLWLCPEQFPLAIALLLEVRVGVAEGWMGCVCALRVTG